MTGLKNPLDPDRAPLSEWVGEPWTTDRAPYLRELMDCLTLPPTEPTTHGGNSVRLPIGFERATWRGTTVVRDGEIGVSFNCADGSIVRLMLPVDCALRVASSLEDYLRAAVVQSERSSGSPTVDGSMPDAGQ